MATAEAEPVVSDDAEPVASDDAEPVASDDAEPVASDDAEPVAQRRRRARGLAPRPRHSSRSAIASRTVVAAPSVRCTPAYSSDVAIGESAASASLICWPRRVRRSRSSKKTWIPALSTYVDGGEVEHEPARVARDARGDRRAEIAGVGHVDLALQVRDDDARRASRT